MSSLDKATETQLANIQKKTGRSLDELYALLASTRLAKHGELRDHLKASLGLGHGDANTLVTLFLKRSAAPAAGAASAGGADPLAEIYTGGKAHLRPIHERLMTAIDRFGAFETAPKKGYVSLRRKKQFAMIGPATQTRVEVGLNMKSVPAAGRLLAQAPGGMCQYKVNLTDPGEVDAELVAWIRTAYDAAG